MKKRSIKLLAIVLTIVLSIVGCSKGNEENKNNNEEVKNNIQESNYIHLTMLMPTTINPILNTDKSVNYIMNLLYDGLFEMDEDYNVEPSLVEKYETSSDGTSIDISLVSNAKWHNKRDVTSSDVDFTVDLIKKNKTSPYFDLVKNIRSINVKDSKNFTISLNESDPFAIDKLTFPIVSKNELSNLKSSELLEYKSNLVGNGPYSIKEYVDRKYMILEVNKNYFGNLPKNRKDIFVKLAPDKESQTDMVMSLDSDIASVNIGELSKFEDKKEFNITNYEGRDYEMVVFNYDNEYLNNTDFRKAIVSSIDREKILKEAYVGYGTLSNFPLNTKSKYYNEKVQPLEYSKEKAKEYLGLALKEISQDISDKKQADENKQKSQGLNGIIEDNAGEGKLNTDLNKEEIKEMLKDIELKIVVSKDNSERIKFASILSANLYSIGIKNVVEELDSEEMTKALNSKDYDLAILGYSLSSIPDARGIIQACNIKDPQITNYINSLANAKSEDETKKVYNQLQKYIVDNASFISLGVLDNFIVTNKRLEGTIYPNDFDIYKGISNLQMNK